MSRKSVDSHGFFFHLHVQHTVLIDFIKNIPKGYVQLTEFYDLSGFSINVPNDSYN